MPVRSATSVSVMPRCSRTLRSRGPTRSSAAADRRPSRRPLHSADSRKQQHSLSKSGTTGDARTHERVRRSSGRRRRRRPVRRPGPGPRPPRGRGGRRRRAPQRTRRAHAGLPVPRRHAARGAAWRPAATRWPATAGTSCSGTVTARRRPRRRRRLRAHPGGRAGHVRRRVLVTTGLRDELPDLPGVRERWGRDLLHCPYCHGHEVRDQRLGVLGGTPDAVQHALLVRQWSGDVVLFSHTQHAHRRPSASSSSPGPSASSTARSAAWSSRTTGCTGVELEDGRVVRRDAVFVRPAFTPNSDLLTGLGCATARERLGRGRPDRPHAACPACGSAGNAVNPRAQVITAAGEGSAAAIAINADLVEEDVPIAVRDFRAGLPA